jgi:hypothetical protein
MDAEHAEYGWLAQGKLEHSRKVTKIRRLEQIVGDQEEHVYPIPHLILQPLKTTDSLRNLLIVPRFYAQPFRKTFGFISPGDEPLLQPLLPGFVLLCVKQDDFLAGRWKHGFLVFYGCRMLTDSGIGREKLQ